MNWLRVSEERLVCAETMAYIELMMIVSRSAEWTFEVRRFVDDSGTLLFVSRSKEEAQRYLDELEIKLNTPKCTEVWILINNQTLVQPGSKARIVLEIIGDSARILNSLPPETNPHALFSGTKEVAWTLFEKIVERLQPLDLTAS